jgi:hypothetical protein
MNKKSGLADNPLFVNPSAADPSKHGTNASQPQSAASEVKTAESERANTRTGEQVNARTPVQVNTRTPERANTRTQKIPI